MYKKKNSLVHSLLVGSLIFLPAIAAANDYPPVNSGIPNEKKFTKETVPGKQSFDVYYGRPYHYAPYYYYYPYRPYFYHYYYYPYRPYYYYYGW